AVVVKPGAASPTLATAAAHTVGTRTPRPATVASPASVVPARNVRRLKLCLDMSSPPERVLHRSYLVERADERTFGQNLREQGRRCADPRAARVHDLQPPPPPPHPP